jgi:hypothetical protein
MEKPKMMIIFHNSMKELLAEREAANKKMYSLNDYLRHESHYYKMCAKGHPFREQYEAVLEQLYAITAYSDALSDHIFIAKQQGELAEVE